MTYDGPERRRHKQMRTRNSEYHFRDNICVGVRDPSSGEWSLNHRALGLELLGGIEFKNDGTCKVNFEGVEIGQQMCFSNDLMTTAIVAIDRPPREVVATYPAQAA